jgi:nucleolar complex protein 3
VASLCRKSKRRYREDEMTDSEDDAVERQFESDQARSKMDEHENQSAPKRLPIKADDNTLVDVEVDSEEEREEAKLREQRAEEKAERLRQLARERREKRKAAIRAKKGLPPKEKIEESSESSEEESSEEEVSEKEEKEIEEIPNIPSKPTKQDKQHKQEDDDMAELHLFVKRQKEVAEQKEKMAALATKVMEEPEKYMKKLRELHEFCEAEDITVRKLAILSELKIFHDIIPSYRIIVGADAGVQLSKEVKKLREFESSILDCYQAYLTTLEQILYQTKEIIKAKAESQLNRPMRHVKSYGKWRPSTVDISGMTPQGIEAMLGLGRTAAMAMGELLVRHHHFNFRANLIMALVPILNTGDVQLSEVVSTSFKNLFQRDPKGSASLEACRTISQLVKKKEYRVRPAVIDILRSLKLRKPLEDGDSIFSSTTHPNKKSKKYMSDKERKQAKKDKEVEKELQETEAVESKKDRDLVQTEMLKVVFLLFFKILKNTKRSPILPNVLEAMAQFSHLINLDLLLNIVEVLKEVIVDPLVPLEASMNTVITAFNAIKLQGDTLEVDLKDFYVHFYKLLEPATASPSKYSLLTPLLVRSLELMLTQRRILALDRVAAYAKRILTLSLHLPAQSCISLLMVLNAILRRYPKTQQLLDTEFTGMGIYMPELDDPENCNVFASTAWEFSLLLEHVHPSVQNLARMVFNQDPITEQNIMRLYHQFDFAKNGIVPSMTPPREHVFVKSLAKAKKAGRDNVYYIQPQQLYGQTSFATELETRKSKVATQASGSLFLQHYHDIQSLMEMDGYYDGDIITDSEEEQ